VSKGSEYKCQDSQRKSKDGIKKRDEKEYHVGDKMLMNNSRGKTSERKERTTTRCYSGIMLQL
jgi:hypothetical protein